MIIVGVAVMIGVGLVLQRKEVESPLDRIRKEVQQLARGELTKLHDGGFGGKFGGLARDINAALERYTHAPAAPSEMAGKDLNAILGGKPGPGAKGSTFDLPSSDSAFSGNTPPPAFGFAPPPPPAFAPPPAPSFAPPPAVAPAKPASAFPAAKPAAPKPAAPSWAPPPATASALPSAALGGDTDEADAPDDDGATRVVPYDHNEEEAAHFAHVYDEFLTTKKNCGESTAGMSIDKFLVKLRDNKAALVAKHGCRTVRFSVYVKDGKAALKATPVRD
jgi:hypothetical protein